MIEGWIVAELMIFCGLIGFIYMTTQTVPVEDHMGDFITYGTDKD